jgi:DNA-binding MarR family transcriptional regulator
MKPLSPLQSHALAVLADLGTADAREIAARLLVDGRSLGPVLRGLELRGLIARTTWHHSTRRAYYATEHELTAHSATLSAY